MKAPEVHKLMSRIWTPFLCEHGLQRTSKTRKGWGSLNGPDGYIQIGYELGGGYHDWTGNSIELRGHAVNKVQQRAIHLEPSPTLLEKGLYPVRLLQQLRKLGIGRIDEILHHGQEYDRDAANYLVLGKFFREDLQYARDNPRYAPPFQYIDEDDLRTWCKIVLPFIPECINTLMSYVQPE